MLASLGSMVLVGAAGCNSNSGDGVTTGTDDPTNTDPATGRTTTGRKETDRTATGRPTTGRPTTTETECTTPSTDDLERLLPDTGDDFSAIRMVRSGIQTGTDTWIAQVLRGPNGFDYGYIVAQYESPTAAQNGVDRLIEESTTTPAYVRTGSYLFFVDGAGSNDNIQRLLAMTPTLSRACVQNGIVFPNAGSNTTTATTTQGNNTSTCATPSTDDLESLLPDLGGEFSADRLVRSGIDTGTDSWIGQVLTGPEGFQYAYVVAKYESESAAEEGATRLVEAATTTPAYVVTGQYVFFVDGAGSNDNIQRLLALTPALSSECVDDTVVFPNSPALGLADIVGSHCW